MKQLKTPQSLSENKQQNQPLYEEKSKNQWQSSPKGLNFLEQTGTGAFNWASRTTSIIIDHKSRYFRIILSASEMLINEVNMKLERYGNDSQTQQLKYSSKDAPLLFSFQNEYVLNRRPLRWKTQPRWKAEMQLYCAKH